MPNTISMTHLPAFARTRSWLKALAQIKDEEYFVTLDEESNSIAVIMKLPGGQHDFSLDRLPYHRWEKPDRNRDQEFVIGAGATKDEVFTTGRKAGALLNTLDSLQPTDLDKTIFIRSKSIRSCKQLIAS